MDRRACPIRCEACGEEVERIPEVGDVWLDAGIVPFSTLGWQNPECVPDGYATGAAKGLPTRRPARPRVLGGVVPGRLGLGDARADPALVLLAALHVGGARPAGRRSSRCSATRRCSTRHGREMHGSWGNMIDAERRVRAHGRRRDALAVLRAAARPEPPLRLRPGARDQAAAPHALELGLVPRRLRERSRASSRATPTSSAGRTASCGRSTAGSSRARAQLVAEATAGYERCSRGRRSRAFEAFVDDLSNWYIRRSRRRFWDGDEAAFRTLWSALVQALRVIAPVMPFLAEHLWQNLVARRVRRTRRTRSSSPAGPRRASRTRRCSRRSPRCGASSSSAARRARRPT